MLSSIVSCFLVIQAILASAFAKKDHNKATATASRVLQVVDDVIQIKHALHACNFDF